MGKPQRRCSSCGETYAESVLFRPGDGSAWSVRAADNGRDRYLGQTLPNAYRLESLIGAGAVGRVDRARQLGVERPVALKIMHAELVSNEALRDRFRREARLAASLNHPNIAGVLAVGEISTAGIPVPLLLLEYLDGLSLRSALAARGSLPATRILLILLQIADAVGEAHQRGIVHRDLKPENVMLVRRGEDADFGKVLDFGVARESFTDPALATRAGAIFGSARCVAPRCASGGDSSPASDVYALATMRYECSSGKAPSDGQNAIQTLVKQQSEAVPTLEVAGLPEQLARLFEANLTEAPAAGAADGRVFARELMLAARSAGLDPGPASRTRRGHSVTLAEKAQIPARAVAAPDLEPDAKANSRQVSGFGKPALHARGLALAAFAALSSFALTGRAQGLPERPSHADEEYDDPRLARGFQALSRPNGIAEVGVGWLTLPGASVCTERSTGSGCRKGDSSFDLEAWEVFRSSKRFAFGAGLLLGLIPTTDAPRSDPPGITRNHSRSYLTLEGQIRYYPYVGESLELWLGASGGLAVVSDRFVVSGKNSDLALVGQRGVTIRTEGESIGAVAGAMFWLAPHWSLGTVFRYGNWFLPKKAAKDPLLDEASLTGRNTMFSLGLTLAYRVPL